MKTKIIILLVFLFIGSKANSQTINLHSINGALYKTTASGGITYASNGTVTYIGTVTITLVTIQELSDAGLTGYSMDSLPSVQFACNVRFVTSGLGNAYRVTNSKCGPLERNNNGDGSQSTSCANSNNLLCSGRLEGSNVDNYLNEDCD